VSVEFGIITSVIPPQGWHFPQQLSSGQTHKITGFSFEQLLENMLEFRRRHLDLCGAENARIEAVRADLKAYLCAHFKQNCADSPGGVPQASGIGTSIVQKDYNRPIDRAGSWLSEIALTRPELVDYGLSGHRAQICAQCPQNVRWKTSCAPCNETVEVRIQNLLGNLRTPYDDRLFMCRCYGWANAAAVWMKDPKSTAIYPPPDHCWWVQEEAQKHG
jgi:hypothetical protein